VLKHVLSVSLNIRVSHTDLANLAAALAFNIDLGYKVLRKINLPLKGRKFRSSVAYRGRAVGTEMGPAGFRNLSGCMTMAYCTAVHSTLRVCSAIPKDTTMFGNGRRLDRLTSQITIRF